MIFEILITIISKPFLLLFRMIPSLSINIPIETSQGISNLILMLKVFVPFDTIFQILSIQIIIINWRIIYSIINKIWQSIPFI